MIEDETDNIEPSIKEILDFIEERKQAAKFDRGQSELNGDRGLQVSSIGRIIALNEVAIFIGEKKQELEKVEAATDGERIGPDQMSYDELFKRFGERVDRSIRVNMKMGGLRRGGIVTGLKIARMYLREIMSVNGEEQERSGS